MLVQANKGRWEFIPRFKELKQDHLPADAWTGFLEEPAGLQSTRTDFRSFNLEEQKRILTVGACLTCHDEGSNVMKNSLKNDFSYYLTQLNSRCIVPDF